MRHPSTARRFVVVAEFANLARTIKLSAIAPSGDCG
jgi:hypothetical protein